MDAWMDGCSSLEPEAQLGALQRFHFATNGSSLSHLIHSSEEAGLVVVPWGTSSSPPRTVSQSANELDVPSGSPGRSDVKQGRRGETRRADDSKAAAEKPLIRHRTRRHENKQR